ncbi:hypothetical protein [Capnocytophaga sp.]|uniref:TolB family protein n=1 Tax=Capnocytophaga sp. TaxID=44737 RepID=UPI0026DB820B|nr:hypothetical protein [Capnocytophaga sp.]MDO5105592.1 hypothetical protein [Capnocytophaga sp.]
MKNKIFLLLVSVLFVSCMGCSKSDGSEGGNLHGLSGTLFIEFAGDVSVYNLSANKFTENVTQVSSSALLETYDVSWDASKVLFTLDVSGFNHKRIVYRDIKASVAPLDVKNDGNNIYDFEYEWGDVRSLRAFISPNEKYIALQGQGYSDMPLIIIESNKDKEIARCEPNNVRYHDWGKPFWTLDNVLYVQIADVMYRMAPTNNYQPEAIFKTGDAGVFRINPQGTKFVFRKDKHLWLCNVDGSNPVQITTSKTYDWADWDGEGLPVFSPDGKYIAFTARGSRGMAWSDHDYPDGSWVGAVGGKFGYLAVIPADGKLYNLDDKNSDVISLTKNGSRGIPCNGHLVWR